MKKGIYILNQDFKHSQLGGQIAVFLTLVLAAIFIFMVITLNIGKVSELKTTTSMAADGAAIMLASNLSSIDKQIWDSFMQQLKGGRDDFYGEQHNYKICKISLLKILTFGALVVLTVITVGGAAGLFGAMATKTLVSLGIAAATTAAGFGVELALDQKFFDYNNRLLANLAPKPRLMEQTAQYALRMAVDDNAQVQDVHDINFNGETTDLVPRFAVWLRERSRNLTQDFAIDNLVQFIRDFSSNADSFRHYIAGKAGNSNSKPNVDDYPELKMVHPEWVEQLKQLHLLPADYQLNACYPEDGSLLDLLAKFEVQKLCDPKKGLDKPMKITNVDIRGLATLNLRQYQEEIKHDFPFWDKGVNRDFACDPLEYGKGRVATCDYQQKPCKVDEVDYATAQLEEFRYWAEGVFDYAYDGSGSLRFNNGLLRMTDQQIKSGFTSWYPNLYNVFDPSDENTWFIQVSDLIHKVVGPPAGAVFWQLPKCGWWLELNKVRRQIPFFNMMESDVSGNGLYKGLGGIAQQRDPYAGGKRRELRDKMDAICAKLMELVNTFNSQRCSEWNWWLNCNINGRVDATPILNINCLGCYKVACVDAMINAVNQERIIISRAIDALNAARQACKNCCQTRLNECKQQALDLYNRCNNNCSCNCSGLRGKAYDDCVSGCAACQSSCANEYTARLQQCDNNYNACLGSCDFGFQPPIDCRNRELSDIDNKILYLLQHLRILAVSLEFTEGLITDIESAQSRFDDFWITGNNLVTVAQNSAPLFQSVNNYDLDCSSGSCKKIVTYPWTTKDFSGKIDLHHYVRVTVDDFKIPSGKTKRCAWIFGKGAELIDYTGDVRVLVERFDEDKALALGGKTNWFNWIFRLRPTNALQFGCPSVKSAAGNADTALRCYGIKSEAKARYHPELEKIGITK